MKYANELFYQFVRLVCENKSCDSDRYLFIKIIITKIKKYNNDINE